jgi:adenylyl-sulfate reductase (glutathione)
VADTFGLKTFPTLVMLPKAGGAPIRYPSDRRDVDTMRMWVKSVAGTA